MGNTDPFRLLDVLCCHNVPFVIIGGHAVAYHGFLRANSSLRLAGHTPAATPVTTANSSAVAATVCSICSSE